MPKRTDIKSILILGSGPIIIGQACEFDYSGVQACHALKKIGYKIILVNSNPATIMTDPELADVTYIEPIHWEIIKKIIKKERPNAILPTMGGQTALNCTLDLYHHNILYNYNVEIIGATINSIKKAEDRKLFEKCMKKIGLKTAKCEIVNNIKTAYKVINKIGFPAIIRPSFTMGGSGGGIAYNYEEFTTICKTGLKISPTKELLIDESLIGWKEYEMEVVRDKHDNCLVICSIENIDPMGIHTGDSITITPAQTLTDKEYQIMRNASISILREIGVETGGANVQFAINPKTGKMIVIEMNPRVSRSSALASKATGVPIAKISAQLAIGLTLDEIKNDMIGENTTASFEPSIDYVVTKIPRFNFEKFPGCNDRLTTQMKSVGEVMAIGRTFQESIQKAMQSLEIGVNGFDSKIKNYNKKTQIAKIKRELKEAGSERLWYIADAFRMKMTISEIFHLTLIDKWFLFHIKELIDIEEQIKKININSLNYNYFKFLKQKGFSDLRIAKLTNSSEQQIRNKRHNLKLYPVYKRIDTCAAEFSNNTAYMYSTWEDECESNPTNNKKIIIVGGGPNRIGQGIEFDYCCVHATQILKKDGFETIMINCNPETVSTDYDISDRLYFEPVTLEKILEIVKIEKPYGVIIQYGGQTPLKLAKDLEKENIPIIGTSPNSIDQAENRKYFQKIVSKLKLKQPLNSTVNTLYEALNQAKNIKYPIMIRPSYVLGGQSMEIVNNDRDLTNYFQNTFNKFKQASILLDHYLEEATEVDVDAICDGKNVLIGGIMEHIEPAGIHSGDSACSLPVYTLSPSIQKEIKSQVKKLAISLSVKGLMNVQFAIKNKEIYIIEVNPRASRTIPFVSKATGLPLAKIAARVMIGKTLIEQNYVHEITPSFYSVKEVVLPFNKFYGVVPTLGPEMKSTGEVMGIGKNFQDAFSKAMLGAQIDMKRSGRVLISVKDNDKNKIIPLAIKLKQNGFKLDATNGTAIKLINSGISVRKVNKVHEGRLNVLDRLKNNEYVYIINTTNSKQTLHDSKVIYYIAIQNHIHYDTTINGAHATIMAITTNPKKYITSLQDMHKTQKKIKNNL